MSEDRRKLSPGRQINHRQIRVTDSTMRNLDDNIARAGPFDLDVVHDGQWLLILFE
jgi:hypothetical protein